MDPTAIEKSILSSVLNTVIYMNKVHVFGCLCITVDGKEAESLTIKINKLMGQVDKPREKHIEDSLHLLRNKFRKRSNSFDSRCFTTYENENIQAECSAFRRSRSKEKQSVTNRKPVTDVGEGLRRENTENENKGPMTPNSLEAGTIDPKQRLVFERALKEFLKMKYQQKLNSKTSSPSNDAVILSGSSPIPPELLKLVSLQARIMGVSIPNEFSISGKDADSAAESQNGNWSALFKDISAKTPLGISELILNKTGAADTSGENAVQNASKQAFGQIQATDNASGSQDLGITKQKRLSFTSGCDKYQLEQGAFAKAMHKKLNILNTKSKKPDMGDLSVSKRKSLFRTGSTEKRKEFVKQMLEKCSSRAATEQSDCAFKPVISTACDTHFSPIPNQELRNQKAATVGNENSKESAVKETVIDARHILVSPHEIQNISNISPGVAKTPVLTVCENPNSTNIFKHFLPESMANSSCGEETVPPNMYTFKPIEISHTENFVPSPSLRNSETFPSQESRAESVELLQKEIKPESQSSHVHIKLESNSRGELDTEQNDTQSCENAQENASKTAAPHPFLTQDSINALMHEELDNEHDISNGGEDFKLPFSDIDCIPDMPVIQSRRRQDSSSDWRETGLGSTVVEGRIMDFNEDSNTSLLSVGSVGFETNTAEASDFCPTLVKQESKHEMQKTGLASISETSCESNLSSSGQRRKKSKPRRYSCDKDWRKRQKTVELSRRSNGLTKQCDATADTSKSVPKVKLVLKRKFPESELDRITENKQLTPADVEPVENRRVKFIVNRNLSETEKDKIKTEQQSAAVEKIDASTTPKLKISRPLPPSTKNGATEAQAKRVKYDMSLLKKIRPVPDYTISTDFVSNFNPRSAKGCEGSDNKKSNLGVDNVAYKFNAPAVAFQKSTKKRCAKENDNVRKNAYKSLPVISNNSVGVLISVKKDDVSKTNITKTASADIKSNPAVFSKRTNLQNLQASKCDKEGAKIVRNESKVLPKMNSSDHNVPVHDSLRMTNLKEKGNNVECTSATSGKLIKKENVSDCGQLVKENATTSSQAVKRRMNSKSCDEDVQPVFHIKVSKSEAHRSQVNTQPFCNSSPTTRTSPYSHLLVRPVPTLYSSPALSKARVSPKSTSRLFSDTAVQKGPIPFELENSSAHNTVCDSGLTLKSNSLETNATKNVIENRSAVLKPVLGRDELKTDNCEQLVVGNFSETHQNVLQVKPTSIKLERNVEELRNKFERNTVTNTLTTAKTNEAGKIDKENDNFVKFVMSPFENDAVSPSKSKKGSSKRKRSVKRKNSKSKEGTWSVPVQYQRLPQGSGRAGKAKNSAADATLDAAGFKMKKYWSNMYGPGSPLTNINTNN